MRINLYCANFPGIKNHFHKNIHNSKKLLYITQNRYFNHTIHYISGTQKQIKKKRNSKSSLGGDEYYLWASCELDPTLPTANGILLIPIDSKPKNGP